MKRALANPADVIKGKRITWILSKSSSTSLTCLVLALVRMQAHYPEGRPYRNTAHAFATVFREGAHSSAAKGHPIFGGLRALWRGAEATIARGVILSISQICSYDQVKQMLKSKGVMKEGMSLHLTASLFAGYVSGRKRHLLAHWHVCVENLITLRRRPGCSAPSHRIPSVSP